MARRLVDKYPCVKCGEKVEVRSRREIEHAHCERCAQRTRHLACASFGFKRAQKMFNENNAKGDVMETVRWVMEVAAEATQAASRAICAAQLNPNQMEASRWVDIAHEWARWASGLIDQSIEVAKGLDRLAVAPSLETPPELSIPKQGHLRVLKGGAR